MLTDLVGEKSNAAQGIWQDTAAAAGRLHEQVDQSLAVSILENSNEAHGASLGCHCMSNTATSAVSSIYKHDDMRYA
jgi:hypothetical protein